MSLTISVRFLTGLAHLHPWQSHHSEGRVEWPPSPWRLLRAIVAVAGRGLTSLPDPDDVAPLRPESEVTVGGTSSFKRRGVPKEAIPTAIGDVDDDELPLSRLAAILGALTRTPDIWVPRTSGGHTRQYFPIHEGGIVKNTGSAVFDTFAAVAKNQPLLFHWPTADLGERQHDLDVILGRMTYFGRAESWSSAQAYRTAPDEIAGVVTQGPAPTHWRCVCIEEGARLEGKEYRDYTLERRLAAVRDIKAEAVDLLPRTKTSDGKARKATDAAMLRKALESELAERLLLRCLLRESGQDIRDGLERPIGALWVHFAVPRAVYDVPVARSLRPSRTQESVNLVRYALNTASVNRPVLPAVTDTLLVADRFRSAVMALRGEPSPSLSGHQPDGTPCEANQHAYWWPIDGDNDGFIDHVMVWAPGGFDTEEVNALRRLTRLRQRGGRPDLLVTPTFVGLASDYLPWSQGAVRNDNGLVRTFVSATPYFCPIHLSHGRGRSGRVRPVVPELVESLKLQGFITDEAEVERVEEIVFDYAPRELGATLRDLAADRASEPVPPRQYFPAVPPSPNFPPLPRLSALAAQQFLGACVKDPDAAYPFGLSVGLRVDCGTRFIRAMSFCRRRREIQAKGCGRMFMFRFRTPRSPRPFAIGDQCHFGLGLFVPARSE